MSYPKSLSPRTPWENATSFPSPASLENRLLLADRGYMDARYAAAVDAAGGHFIVRFKKQFSPEVGGKRVWNVTPSRNG